MKAPQARALPQTVAQRDFLALFSAVMLPMFLASVDQTLLATATPHIAAEFGGLTDSPWIALGYLIAATVMIPLYGRWGDEFGRRRALLAALAVFAVGSVLGGLAPGLGALVAARVLQGLGGGGRRVSAQALIGEVVPPRERARFQGYFAAVFTVSSVAGPVLGGLIVASASWRWLFWLNLPLCLIAAWRVRVLPVSDYAAGTAAAPRRAADWAGVALFAGTTVAGLVWVTFAGHRFAWLSPPSLALFAASACLLTLLVRHERRVAAPFLPVELLALPGLRAMALTIAMFAAALFALIFFLPIYLQLGRGTGAAGSGLLLLPLMLGLVSGSALTGRIVARRAMVGETPRYGLALSALALAIFAAAPPHPLMLGVLCYACGLGFGTVMPNAQILMQVTAGRQKLGAASSLASLSRSTGSALGAAMFGALAFALIHLSVGEAVDLRSFAMRGESEAVVRAFHIAWGVLAAWVALAAWVGSRVPRVDISTDAAAQ
jgi:MFS family permease